MLTFCSTYLASQELEKPLLKFSYACASNSFNSFETEISYNSSPFNSDNVFTIELSDKDGNFSSPTIVKTVSNQNSSFKFTTAFQIPNDAHGTGYKIRVKSSSPQQISPESDAFEAYYATSQQLILNNFTDVILCDGASKDLQLNITNASQYQWYKDGIKLQLSGPSLTVTEPGLYYSEIYYGSCVSSAISNIVEVTKLPKLNVEILGNETVELCDGDEYVLEAKEKNNNYKYFWYKDGIKITSLPEYSPTYTIKDKTQLGVYHLEVENQNGCVNTSSNVLIKEPVGNLEVSEESNLTIFLLKGETKTLKINHNGTNATIEWFKDGVAISSSNSKEIQINESGEYLAKVTTTGSSCTFVQESKTFNVIALKSLRATVAASSNYISCELGETTVSVKEIIAIGTNDEEYLLSENQYIHLDFQWFFNGTAIVGANSQDIQIRNYTENGSYHLNILSDTISVNTDNLTIQLKLPEVIITSSSVVNTICSGQTITLQSSIINGVSYQWFKDNISISTATTASLIVTEIGNYKLKTTGFGCTNESEEFVITAFDEAIIQIDTSLNIALNIGETKTINASGGDSYLWKDDQGTLLSSTSTLTIDKPGTYFLIAKIGNCEVQKELTVTELGTEIIPNVITSNGDGINDFWILSNRYAFNKEIVIEIYTTDGKQVLKTANYQNNWPSNLSEIKSHMYYYIIKKENKLLKKGTISVIK